MANVKISELTSATTPLAGTELIEIVQSGVNKKVAVSEVGGTPPTLQEVTTAGNETTDSIIIDKEEEEAIFLNVLGESVGILSNFSEGAWFVSQARLDNENITIYRNGSLSIRKDNVSPKTLEIPYKDGTLSIDAIEKTASFTAENDTPYSTNGTITVTDPTPVTNKGYIVHVIGGTTTIDGVGYTAGALVYRYYDGSVWTSVNYKVSATDIDALKRDGSNANSDVDISGAYKLNSGGVRALNASDDIKAVFANNVQSATRTGLYGEGDNTIADVDVDGNGVGDILYRLAGDKIQVNETTDVTEIATDLVLPAETASRIASFDSNKKITSLDTATYPSLTELAYVKGVTSAIQTQLNLFYAHKARTIHAPAASVTGVATQTVIATMPIPANVYASTDAFMFNMAVKKGVTASTVEYKIYVGASAGALTTQIGRFIANSATLAADFVRPFSINSGTLNTSVGFNVNVITGEAQQTTAGAGVSVTTSSDWWITITAAPTNAADVSGIDYASIIPLK